MLREIRSRHRTYISKVVHHPNQVVEVQIKKERMRRARAGQYIMINCPAVSYWQWHPFTLTSAPEEDPCVHIRESCCWGASHHAPDPVYLEGIVGDWTREFAAALGCETGRNELYSKDLGGEDPQSPLSRILPRVMVSLISSMSLTLFLTGSCSSSDRSMDLSERLLRTSSIMRSPFSSAEASE